MATIMRFSCLPLLPAAAAFALSACADGQDHTFHGHVFHSYFGALKTRFFIEAERYLGKKSHRIIAISDLQKKELSEDFPQNVRFKNGLAVLYAKLGAAHTSLGDLQQALTNFERFTQLMKELHEASPQNVEYKSNYSESLAVFFRVKKCLSQTQETSHIDLAVKIFEELYLSSQRPYYQQKIDICFQMKESTGEDLRRLISEISGF